MSAAQLAELHRVVLAYAPDNMTQWYGPNGDAHTAEEIRDSSPFPELLELALRLQAADELAPKRENTNGS